MENYKNVLKYKKVLKYYNRINLINIDWCLKYDDWCLMYDKKPKKVSFDDNLKFCYSDVIYKNGIPLFFNLQNN